MNAPSSSHSAEIDVLNARVAELTVEIQSMSAAIAALTVVSYEIPNIDDLQITEIHRRIDKLLGADANTEQKAKAYSIIEQLQKRARLTMNSPDNLR